MARKASTLLALANVASALSAVPRSGLSLTKALAPELLDFGEASSRDAAATSGCCWTSTTSRASGP